MLPSLIKAKQVEQRAVLEKLCGKAGIGPEQKRMLVADHPRIEVRNGHRRRADVGLAVDFGVMAFVDRRIVAAQPDAADRKAGIAVPLGNPGFLQQRQSAAAGAEKDEFRRRRHRRVVGGVHRIEAPAAILFAPDAGDPMRIMNGKAAETLQIADEIAGQRAVIHVGAGDHAGRGDDVVGRAAFHDERDPFPQGLLVLGKFHSPIEMVRGQRGVALLEKGDIGRAVDEAHMRHRMDEQVR